jgi:hypothetical protein
LDTTEVIEAESEAMLHILTEHDFKDAFRICRRAGNDACVRKGITSRAVVAIDPKLILD